ncbi:DMT family transporter [Marihabitans asiaticum]|uniref:DME family drug/metabolite transporter n=1 Tax=Marihabitans asiaticum TaxID=415218 RepID=A0A560WDU3_9MICO|nr:DME family drug/metabolite transporter [Marihabitans asiaticum]
MPAVRRAGRAHAALAAVAAASLWGTTGTAQALGPPGTDPVSVGAIRICIGALVLVVLAAAAGSRSRAGSARPVPVEPDRSRRAPVAVLLGLGGLAVAAYQACFFLGVERAGVAVGTVITLGLAPLATGALGLLLGERLGGRWSVATAGAVLGVVLLVVGTAGASPVEPIGVAAAVGAALSYAGYTVAARGLLLRGVPGMTAMAGLFSIGAVVLSPALTRADLSWLATGRGLAVALWLGVVATGVSYVLFQRGLAGLAAGTVATLSLAEPVTATLLGVLVLQERLSGLSAVGMALIVLALLLLAAPRRAARPLVP